MLFKKEGFPQEEELVLCTVKNILHNSVFVTLDEYKDREGIVHISEIAPGRIRTIRDYVVENKKIVCTILRVNEISNHIELSLRRVSKSMKNKKNEELNLENISEKILNHLATLLNIPFDKVVENIGRKIFEKHSSLYQFFSQALTDKKVLSEFIPDKKAAEKLYELIAQRFKPPEIEIYKDINIKSAASNGIEIIKNSIMSAIKMADELKCNVLFTYLGAPKYRVYIKNYDYKVAQGNLDKIIDFLAKELRSNNAEIEMKK